MVTFRIRARILIFLGTSLLCWTQLLYAEETSKSLDELRREIKELRESDAEKDKKLQLMEKRLDELDKKSAKEPAASPKSSDRALDQAIQQLDPSTESSTQSKPEGLISKSLGSAATLRLLDISLDGLFAVGGSTEDDLSLQTLQGGDHDPKKRGFTLGQAELSLGGAVDPYISGEAHIVYKLDAISGDSEFDLEEAFLTTQTLPFGLQIKGGHYLTEFGRLNPTHPHAWLWMDQPVINTRIFGADGLRVPGARLAWLIPLPWFAEFYAGVQNANGETALSFLGNDETFIGGHPFVPPHFDSPAELLYSTRLVNSFNIADTVTAQIGASGLFGPNSTGAQGRTYVYGGDFVVKWKPTRNFRGWPFITFESEAMHRIFQADRFSDVGDPTVIGDEFIASKETLHDYGFYSQLLYGFYPRWAAGVRYEYVNGDDQDFYNRHLDPMRDERHRVSPLLAFYLSEFSRLRLQYNYDHADHLVDDAHSVWGGIEFLIGTHPAHKF